MKRRRCCTPWCRRRRRCRHTDRPCMRRHSNRWPPCRPSRPTCSSARRLPRSASMSRLRCCCRCRRRSSPPMTGLSLASLPQCTSADGCEDHERQHRRANGVSKRIGFMPQGGECGRPSRRLREFSGHVRFLPSSPFRESPPLCSPPWVNWLRSAGRRTSSSQRDALPRTAPRNAPCTSARSDASTRSSIACSDRTSTSTMRSRRCSSRCFVRSVVFAVSPRSRRGSIGARCASRTPISRATGRGEGPRSSSSRSSRPGIRRRSGARWRVRRPVSLYAELDKIDAKQRIAFTLHVLDGHSARRGRDASWKRRSWRRRRACGERVSRSRPAPQGRGAGEPCPRSGELLRAYVVESTRRKYRERTSEDSGGAPQRGALGEDRRCRLRGARRRGRRGSAPRSRLRCHGTSCSSRAARSPRRSVLLVVFRVAGSEHDGRATSCSIRRTSRRATTPSRLAVGESTIEIGPSSAVVASGDDAHGILVVVEKGKVDCEVTPRKDRPPFVVQAGNVRVRVVGTRFVVARDGGAVRVSVAHGAVEVSRGADVTCSTTVSRGRPCGAPPLPPRFFAGAGAFCDDDRRAVAERERRRRRSPRRVRCRPPSHRRTRRGRTRPLRAARASDPDGAMTAYRRLASSGGPWASTALFAAGRLAADRGRSGEAKQAARGLPRAVSARRERRRCPANPRSATLSA